MHHEPSYHAPSPSYHEPTYHEPSYAPSYGYGHRRPSALNQGEVRQSFFLTFLQKTKSHILQGFRDVLGRGARRLEGGTIALIGGWLKGQGYYLNNYRLNDFGDQFIEYGTRVSGYPPYGPNPPARK